VKNLLIKDAKLRNKEGVVDILVSNGKIVSIEKELKLNTDEVFDAQGNLVTPTFVDTHLHIDKAYTASYGRSSKEETLEESIKIMHDIKRNYTVEDVRLKVALKQKKRQRILLMFSLLHLLRKGYLGIQGQKSLCIKLWIWERMLSVVCQQQNG